MPARRVKTPHKAFLGGRHHQVSARLILAQIPVVGKTQITTQPCGFHERGNALEGLTHEILAFCAKKSCGPGRHLLGSGLSGLGMH